MLLLIALSLVVRLMPIDLAVSAPAEPPSRGSLELRHDISPSSPLQEQDGPLILLRVRALVPEKITLSAAHRNCHASLARENILFLQAILFRKP